MSMRTLRSNIRVSDHVVTWYLRALLGVGVVALIFAIVSRFIQGGSTLYVEAGFLLAYLLWLFAESNISVKPPREPSAELLTLVIYATTRAATALSAAFCPSVWGASAWRAAGWGQAVVSIALFVVGVSVRLWSIRSLRHLYSHHVVTYSEHPIVDTGPYRILRHPAYTGMLMAHLGLVIFFASPTTVAFGVALAIAIAVRIHVEEKVMNGMPGYSEFARGRRRLIPGVW
jgi:protein-S-isoprenylcysteine O-methyltransferase Ste14